MRNPLFLLLSLILSLTLVACDGGDGDGDDGPAEDTMVAEDTKTPPAEDTVVLDDVPEGLLPFGGECTDDAECDTGLCHDFGQGTWCTLACEESDECPEGSEGQKCNKQKVCRP